MPLQSSGQITLAEVRNEFFGNTGTTQFAMSGLYGKGNAPASSGEIKLAADFYGTSAGFASGNIGVGTRTLKAGTDQKGFSNGNGNAGTGGGSFGSISNNSISNSSAVIGAIYIQVGTGPRLTIFFDGATYTNWTTLTINGNYSVNRTAANTNTGSRYDWNGNFNLPTTFVIT